jgi:multidrug transporter EmrE-like cation transporter
MDVFYLFIILLVAILSALPVILVKNFVATKQDSFISILIFIIEIVVLEFLIIISYFYFIIKKISMADFYPIIKLIEMLIPVIVSVLVYKDKINNINYIGLLLAIIAIICIQW